MLTGVAHPCTRDSTAPGSLAVVTFIPRLLFYHSFVNGIVNDTVNVYESNYTCQLWPLSSADYLLDPGHPGRTSC